MDEPIYVIGHRHPDTDSVGAAIAYAHLKNAKGEAQVRPARAGALNRETQYALERFALPEPVLLDRATGLRLILVDHNEVAQALDDIQHGTVLEVWEHHRVGDLDIPQPILFHCEPVGATSTLIAEQYFLQGVVPPPGIAGVLLASILSDTVGLVSPTTTEKDRAMARRLEALAQVDAGALGQALLRARGDLSGRSAEDLVESDFKEFSFAGQRVGIGQVEVSDAAPLLLRREELQAALRRAREQKGLLQAMLLVTDITRRGSHLWFVGERPELLEAAIGQPLVDGAAYLDGWMSRKKQLVPPLERAFAEAQEGSARASPRSFCATGP